jgi:transcriptional regulator with XRE-family HTH domain
MGIMINMNIYFEDFRLSKKCMEAFEIEEHSLENFGEALLKVIRASGIKHQVLAKAMKVSSTTIHNYIIRERRNPKREFIVKIADYFDIKPSYFKEYRLYQLDDRFDMFPELIDIFIDLSMNPQRIKGIIKAYKERNPYENLGS